MATTLQFRRYTTAELSSLTGAVGELIVDTDKDTITVHDGSAAGGVPLATAAAVSAKQDTLVSGTNIKTINGTSLLGSGNVTISGGSVELFAVQEDILPEITEVYDIGSTFQRWFDVYASNSVNIGGSAVMGNDAGISIDTLLAGDLLINANLITPDSTTAVEYAGDKGIVVVNGNLDIQGDWVKMPIAETIESVPPLTTGQEGFFRYNKDVSQLELYTDSWGPAVPAAARFTPLTQGAPGTYELLEIGKRYLIINDLSTAQGGITLPDLRKTPSLQVGDSIEFFLYNIGTNNYEYLSLGAAGTVSIVESGLWTAVFVGRLPGTAYDTWNVFCGPDNGTQQNFYYTI